MIAYNVKCLDTLLTQDAAREWHRQGLLSEEKWRAVQERHTPQFYTPNVFIRIGLGIFCCIALSAAMGFFALFLSLDSEAGVAAYCLLGGAGAIALLELWIIGSKKHRASGIDDLLLYFGTWGLIVGLYLIFDEPPTLVCFCMALPILVAGCIRYADRLMAAAAFVCALLIVVHIILEALPDLALYLLPFAGMAFAAAAYWLAQQGQQRWAWRHWHDVLTAVQLLALVTFYASGNIWLIEQIGRAEFQLEQVPMAGFFWVFTLGVPLAYIAWGLRSKNRLTLDVGLGCIAVAVFTFRYYHHVMPLEWAAVLGGAVLFAVAYFSIRFLEKNRTTYTYAPDGDTTMLQELEQQLIEQGIAGQQTPAPVKRESFGGGEFGGGGASGDF